LHGGTGATSPSGGLNNLLPNQAGSGGLFLKTDGNGNVIWSSPDNSSNWIFTNGLTNNNSTIGLGGSLVNGTVIASGGYNLQFTGSGSFGIGTSSAPAAKLEVDGAIYSKGTDGSTPASGAGTRFMWIPAKAAIRAGGVTGSQWDDSNIGDKSHAIGYDATASAPYSIALGDSVSAGGTYSIALGHLASTGTYSGSFVFNDGSTSTLTSAANNTFTARATGGVAFYTASSLSTSVTLPAGGGLNVTGGDLAVTGAVSTGNLTVGGHILTTSTIGSASAGGTASSASVSGSDVSGTITFSASNGSGTVDVAFASSYSVAPVVVVAPANAAAANSATGIGSFYVTSSTTGFTLHVGVGTDGVSSAEFNYIVMH
jgi:hypothetical protein